MMEYLGNCTEDEIVESIFGDATLFAQALESATSIDDTTWKSDGILIRYDPDTDIHSFYRLTHRENSYENRRI